MRRVGVAIGLAAALVAVAVLVHALLSKPELVSSNSRVIRGEFPIVVEPGGTRCQNGEYLPSDAATMRVVSGWGPTQPFVARLRAGRRVVATASSPGGYPAETLHDVPLARRSEGDFYPVEICLSNRGAGQLVLEGNLTSTNPEAPPGQNGPFQRGVDEVRVDYFAAQRSSRLSRAGDVAGRWALFRPGFVEPWMLWLVLAAFLALAVAAVQRFVREVPAD